MAGPIFKVFLNRYTAAYYELPAKAMEKLVAEFRATVDELGIKLVIHCESGWSSEEWDFWGVTEYPNLEAVQKLRQWQDTHQWFKYVESMSVLGVKPAQ